jgi:hypothetical protein
MSKLPELYACVYAKEFPVQTLLRLRPDIRSQAFGFWKASRPNKQCVR